MPSPLSPVLSPFLLVTLSALCLSSVSFCLPSCISSCWSLCPLIWAAVSASRLPIRHAVQLSPSSGLLCLPLACNPLRVFSALGRCVRLCHAILEFHVSPSSQLHVACNPLHLSPCVYTCLPALDCCVRLCLAILCLPALDVTNSSCSVPILRNTKCLGSTVV